MKSRTDQFRFSLRNSNGAQQELIAGEHFRADFLTLSDSLSLSLGPLELDFARIGAAVYVADRLTRRAPLREHHYPSREMELVVGVSDPHFWQQIERELCEPLRFLADDQIKINFVHAPALTPRWINLPLFNQDCDAIALDSGGLDSTAGLINRLTDSTQRYLLVTVEHQPHQRKRILGQMLSLNSGLRIRAIPTFTRATLINPPLLKQQERTQRLRSFFFCALAGAIASRIGCRDVEVLENGIGAVNLPPMEGMFWGGLATRGAHPHFLRLMGRLASSVAGRSIRFDLPFKWWTKGEMVRDAIARGGETVLRDTVSCVHYPLREIGPAKQCGLCPGCLGHLQAMHAAQSLVTADRFRRSPIEIKSLMGPDADYLRAMAAQIYDLSLMRTGQRLEGLRLHLVNSGAITTLDTWDKWLALHLRYASECEAWWEQAQQGQGKTNKHDGVLLRDEIEVLWQS
jgi:7-cyano-7-deazaguanine synthase in queuosine biosynthesis